MKKARTEDFRPSIDKFREDMFDRYKKKSCVTYHGGSPMENNGILLSCCTGGGSNCKYFEIKHLCQVITELCSEKDALIFENFRLKIELEELRDSKPASENAVTDCNWPKNPFPSAPFISSQVPVLNSGFQFLAVLKAEDVLGFDKQNTQQQQEQQNLPSPQINNTTNNITNNITINIIGESVLDEFKRDFLRYGFVGDIYTKVIETAKIHINKPANAQLLKVAEEEPITFKKIVVETIKTGIQDFPKEQQIVLQQGLNTMENEIRKEEEAEKDQPSKG